MTASWGDFIHDGDGGHAVQVYAEPGELASSVSAYLAAGFDLGEPAVVVATPDQIDRFRQGLGAAGWDAGRIEQAGVLTVRDADATLAAIMGSSLTPAAAFEAVVGALLDEVFTRFPGREIRVFGSMVDQLCQRGEETTAALLEELWNDLARSRRFSLLCGYRLDIFDRGSQTGPLPHVCASHTHVLPAADPARLDRAVDLALEDVLGAGDTGKVYSLASRTGNEHIPLPQRALMWVSANMPSLADRILVAARSHYAGEPVAPYMT